MRQTFHLLLASAGLALAGNAHAAEPSSTDRANQLAYEATMKCFVASGVVVGDAREAHDVAKEAKFNAKAHEAFDLAVQLGGRIGYSGNQISADFGIAQARELPKMVKDPAYFKSAVGVCGALGLM